MNANITILSIVKLTPIGRLGQIWPRHNNEARSGQVITFSTETHRSRHRTAKRTSPFDLLQKITPRNISPTHKIVGHHKRHYLPKITAVQFLASTKMV